MVGQGDLARLVLLLEQVVVVTEASLVAEAVGQAVGDLPAVGGGELAASVLPSVPLGGGIGEGLERVRITWALTQSDLGHRALDAA